MHKHDYVVTWQSHDTYCVGWDTLQPVVVQIEEDHLWFGGSEDQVTKLLYLQSGDRRGTWWQTPLKWGWEWEVGVWIIEMGWGGAITETWHTSIIKIFIKNPKDLGMSKKCRNKWWHLSTLTHHISLRIRHPKSRWVHLGPLCKGFRTSDRRRKWKMKQDNTDLRRFSLTHTPDCLWERCRT